MDAEKMTTLIMIPQEVWMAVLDAQQDILRHLKDFKIKESNSMSAKYITALQFMSTVNIGRTKFDQLRATNKIKTIKKRRKIYVPIGEVERYFNDPAIQ